MHFLAIGMLLFVGHRLVTGDPRAVAVTPGLKAELARRFRDSHDGRAPSAQELAGELRGWERDEALYREALRDRLDRNDGTIRTVLADRVRARAALGVPKREPTDADLDRLAGDAPEPVRVTAPVRLRDGGVPQGAGVVASGARTVRAVPAGGRRCRARWGGPSSGAT